MKSKNYYAILTDIKEPNVITHIVKFAKKKERTEFVESAISMCANWSAQPLIHIKMKKHGSILIREIRKKSYSVVWTVINKDLILPLTVTQYLGCLKKEKEEREEINRKFSKAINDTPIIKEPPFEQGGHVVVTTDWQRTIYFYPNPKNHIDKFEPGPLHNLLVHLDNGNREYTQVKVHSKLDFEKQVLATFEPDGEWEYQEIFGCWFIDHKFEDMSFFTNAPDVKVNELMKLPISIKTELIADLSRVRNQHNADLLRYESKISLLKFQKKVYDNTIAELKKSVSDDTRKTQKGDTKGTKSDFSVSPVQ